jgi:hypothetical protein
MAFRLSTKARNAACDAIVDLLDEGASAGLCRIRTGAQPTNVGDAESGTLLGTLTFTDPATSHSSADASGTAGHARFMDSDAEVMFDAECAQGSGTVNFNNTTIVAGGTIAISAMTVTQPIS